MLYVAAWFLIAVLLLVLKNCVLSFHQVSLRICDETIGKCASSYTSSKIPTCIQHDNLKSPLSVIKREKATTFGTTPKTSRQQLERSAQFRTRFQRCRKHQLHRRRWQSSDPKQKISFISWRRRIPRRNHGSTGVGMLRLKVVANVANISIRMGS